MKYIRTKENKIYDLHKYWIKSAWETNPSEEFWLNELLKEEHLIIGECKVADTIE